MIVNLVQAVRAAKVFSAKNDIRYYFNGVALYINDEDIIESVVGTNGYSMAVIGSLELNSNVVVVANRDVDSLCNALTDNVQAKVNGLTIEIGDYKIPLVECRYPHVKRVIPDGKRNPDEMIGIQPNLLSKLKPFKTALTQHIKPKDRNFIGCKMMCGNAVEPVVFEFNNDKIDKALVIINPMRI